MAKQPKKLTLTQKKLLTAAGYDTIKYMFVEEDAVAIRVVNKETKETEWVGK